MNNKKYPVTVAPFNFNNFKELSNAEAKEYFEWYMEVKQKRIYNLEEYINENKNKRILLDYSVESLEKLWNWYKKEIEIEDMTEEDYRKLCEGRPEWLQERIREENTKVSIITWCICQDIAVYFGEVMIKKHETLHWDYFVKPKNAINVKEPIVTGFIKGLYFSPFQILVTLTKRATRNEESSLKEMYWKWEKMI